MVTGDGDGDGNREGLVRLVSVSVGLGMEGSLRGYLDLGNFEKGLRGLVAL